MEKETIRIRRILKGMKQRCYYNQHAFYRIYGGRGITICDDWRTDTNAFVAWALENGYRDDLVIDRIDNDKGYAPDNCHWITVKENCQKQTNVKLSYEKAAIIRTLAGQGVSIKVLADAFGTADNTIRAVINYRTWN